MAVYSYIPRYNFTQMCVCVSFDVQGRMRPMLSKMAIEWCSGQNAVYHPMVQIYNLPDGTFLINTVNTVCGFKPNPGPLA